jgi:S1-C subfamily serine protease
MTDAQARERGLSTAQGAYVSAVDAGSPAQSAGLRAGDVIINAQNRPVTSPGVLAAIIGIASPGSTIDLTYRRDGRDGRARVTVESPRALQVTQANPDSGPALGGGKVGPTRPSTPSAPNATRGQTVLGASFRNVQSSDRLADGTVGAYIEAVAAGSAAARRGLRAGDVVVAVNRVQITSAADMARQLSAASSQAVQIVVLRNNSFVPLTLAE